LEIRRATLGGTHADTMNSLRNLGAVLDMLGQTDEADALLVEAITICETIFGDGSDELASALDYYGVFLWHNNFYEVAPSIAMRSLQIKETIYGCESVKLLGTLQLLADAYRFNKQFDEAVLIVERALKILRFSKIECEPSIEDFKALSGKIDEERHFAEQHENDERRVFVKRHLN
jgi:tetratricopeptide (TPR) repeat protein